MLLKAYRAAGDVSKLAQLIEARVGVSPDGYERKTLLIELAQARNAQDEPELAYLALCRAFKEDPNDAKLRQALEGAADAAKTWDELATTYEEELPRIADNADAAQVCLKLGQLFEQRMQEPEKAAAYYEKARELEPAIAPRALPALDRLYGQLEQPIKQADVLDLLAAQTEEPQEQLAILFRLGQLTNETLEDPDRAAGAFERILAIDSKHLPSLRSLELLYDNAQTHEKLYRVLELQKDLVSGPERERILGKMAMVSAEGLADVGHSIELYRELLEKNPRNEQAFTALDKLLEKGGRFEDLKALLEGKLRITIDPRELVRLNERLGRVLAEHLGQAEEAIGYFKAALERDARHKGALDALRAIYEQAGRRDDLVIVLRRLIPLQDDATGVKALRIRLAEVLAEGDRREEALDAARRALEVEPHQVEELDRVFGVFALLKAWPDAVRALELKSETLLTAQDREAAIEALFKVGAVWTEQALKPEAAGTSLQKILEIDPANRRAYEQALKLYAQVNDWRGYATVMDHYLPHLVTEEEKLATLRMLAQVQETKLGHADVAFLNMCRALQLNPSDPTVREEVERLADATQSYEELAAVYEEVADNQPRGPLAERMYLTLARVHDEKLDDLASAESALRKILEFDPTNQTALDALAAMFLRRGRDKEYVVALEQQLEAAPSIEKRKEILREISRVFSERLQNPAEAMAALSRALELEPDSATLQTLVELQRAQGDHAGMASTLLRMRDIAATPEDRSRIQVEVAQVYERDLTDDEAAIEGFRQALEFDPANVVALDALERLYTKLDRPAELLAVYERQLELSQDYRERVKILFKSASIWEDRYQNLANADACVDAVLQVDPQNMQGIKTLERLRKAQGRWDELIGVVDRHINLLSHPAEKAELCVEMGDIFHQQLKEVDRAVTAYHQALELDPTCRPAMHALGTLYERSGNWPYALEMLEREAQAAGQSAEAVELFHRMGKINEDMLIDPASAKRCYLEALKLDPSYLPCIRALKGIYEIEKDYDSFEKALIEEARQTEDPLTKSKAMLEVARYYADRKEDKDAALGYFEEALKLDPESLEAARPLADLYIARENWEGGERMLDIVTRGMTQKLSQDPDDPELARELCRQSYRLGYVCEKIAKKDKALVAFEQAYQLDATYLPALEGLGHLLVAVQRFDDALKVYQSILIHHRDDLTDLEVVEIYWTLGDIHLQQKQLDRALNHFEKALAIDPGHEPSLRSMVAISEDAGHWDKVAELRQKLLTVLDGEPLYEVAVALGKVAKEKLNDAYMAIDAYLTASKVHPDSLDVLDAMYVLYRETKQGQRAAEVLDKMLQSPQLLAEPQKAKRVWFALGELARDELMDVEKAAEAFNAALDADYRFIEAFSALEAMLGRAKKWKTLDDNYKRMISRLPKTDDTHVAAHDPVEGARRSLPQGDEGARRGGRGLQGGGRGPARRREDPAGVRRAGRHPAGLRDRRGRRVSPRAPGLDQPGQDRLGARRAGGAPQGLRLGLAGGPGGVGADRRGGHRRARDPHQADALREEARGGAALAHRPPLDGPPLPPQGPRAAGGADGDSLRAGRAPLQGGLHPLPAQPAPPPDRRGPIAGVPDSPLPLRGAVAGHGGGGALLALPHHHPRADGEEDRRAPARPDAGDRDLPHPPRLPEGGRQVLRRDGPERSLLPARPHHGVPAPRAGAGGAAAGRAAGGGLPGGALDGDRPLSLHRRPAAARPGAPRAGEDAHRAGAGGADSGGPRLPEDGHAQRSAQLPRGRRAVGGAHRRLRGRRDRTGEEDGDGRERLGLPGATALEDPGPAALRALRRPARAAGGGRHQRRGADQALARRPDLRSNGPWLRQSGARVGSPHTCEPPHEGTRPHFLASVSLTQLAAPPNLRLQLPSVLA